MSRYRYRPITIPLTFVALRYRPLPFYPTLHNVTSTLPTVTYRYRSLQNVTVTTVTCVTSITDRNIRPFEQTFKVTQVTVRFGNGQKRWPTVSHGNAVTVTVTGHNHN